MSPVLSRGHQRWSVCLGVALLGGWGAWRLRWLCDDAYISFRYAENLATGRGLVFNAGEYVEGITNLAWTLWITVGVGLGASAESWSIAWGVVAFAAACAGLAWMAVRDAPDDEPLPVPWAGLVLALHPDALAFATSGLETAALGCALVYVVVLATGRARPRRPSALVRAGLAGLVLAIAAALRPDAILLAPLVAVVPLFARVPGLRRLVPAATRANEPDWTWRCTVVLTLATLAVWVPTQAFRVAYYGDFFPNTYYAKSADLTWWTQGGRFLRVYAERYAAHLVALPLAAWTLLSGDPRRRWAEIYIGLGFTVVYTLYVVRLGGGFMYARLLIPTVPLLALVLEAGIETRPPWLKWSLGPLILLLPWWLEPQLIGAGVTDERAYYTKPSRAAEWDDRSYIMRHYLGDTPARVAFIGTWARAMRDSGVDPAVEAATGLTDATVARQVIETRGLPGHEKRADPRYLADTRRVHLATGPDSYDTLALDEVVLPIEVELPDPRPDHDTIVHLYVVRWDPTLMEQLRERGARVVDLPAVIAQLATQVDAMPLDQCRALHRQLDRMYFDQVDAPRLRAPYVRRCPLAPPD